MIPFDLAKFDCARQTADLSTASRIASVARHFLASPGKERDAAAVVLGRLFQRTDVQRGSHFAAFLDTSAKALASETSNSFEATGILQALCQVVKTAEPAFVAEHFAPIQAIAESYAAPASALERSGLVAKFRTKLTGRLAVKLLRPRARRGANKLHILGPETESASGNAEDDDDESDVPEEIESFISVLIEGCSTMTRWCGTVQPRGLRAYAIVSPRAFWIRWSRRLSRCSRSTSRTPTRARSI